MKFLCALCICFVLGLSLQPIDFQNNSVSQSCGSASCNDCPNQANTKNQKEDDCKNKNCNPFHACCCSLGFVLKNKIQLVGLVYEIQRPADFYVENPISYYSSSVWQPPKIS